MPGENIQDWSTTAASNSNSDSSINWAEGQPRASVNNSSRSMMAAHAKNRNLQNGSILTGGTANAQTFFSGLTYTTVPTGLRVLLKIGPALTNTAAATLEMDGLGAVAIKDQLGADLAAGAITAATYAEFIYSGTNWVLLATLTAPTPAANDDSNKIATTGWVHDEIQSIPGVTDGSSAAAGDVGEFLTAAGIAGGLGVATDYALVTLALTAGDWAVSGGAYCTTVTPATSAYLSLNTSAVLDLSAANTTGWLSPSTDYWMIVGPRRMLLAAPATAYLVTRLQSGGTVNDSRINARRMR